MTTLLKEARTAAHNSLPSFTSTEESQYFELCKGFPLAVIESEEHNRAAVKILGELGRREESLNTGGIIYLKTLSRLVGDFEAVRYSHLLETPATGPEVLQHLIEQSTMTQADLARAVGLDRQNISNYLKGRRALSKAVRLKLCKLFGLGQDVFEYSPAKSKKA